MRKRILLFLPFLAAAVWQWLWEFIRSLFYERGSRMLTPVFGSVTLDDLLRWGLTIGFPALGVWLIWKSRHFSPQSPVIKPTEWKRPFDAIESFGDQTRVAAKNKWLENLDDAAERLDAAESLYETGKKIAELEGKEPNIAGVISPPESPELAYQRRKLKAINLKLEAINLGKRFVTDELPRIWADLREDMGEKLESGELAAKGVPAPYIAGKREAEIAPYEWRLLIIDLVKEQAIEKNSYEVKYVGLVIRKGTL